MFGAKKERRGTARHQRGLIVGLLCALVPAVDLCEHLFMTAAPVSVGHRLFGSVGCTLDADLKNSLFT